MTAIYRPDLGGPSEEEVAKAHAVLVEHYAAIDRQNADSLIRCEGNVLGKGCGELLRIGDLEYIQTHWYTPPRSCSGGDYWQQGEGNFYCPKCGHRNRTFNRTEVETLKGHFKSIVEEHKDR